MTVVAAIALIEGDSAAYLPADAVYSLLEAASVMRCVHCQCTESSACTIDVALLAPDERRNLEEYGGGEPLPDRVRCWWISLVPPVCSNPQCAAAHRRARAAGITP